MKEDSSTFVRITNRMLYDELKVNHNQLTVVVTELKNLNGKVAFHRKWLIAASGLAVSIVSYIFNIK